MNPRMFIPWSGICGCIIGVCIAALLKIMLIPASRNSWPSYVESRYWYLRALTKSKEPNYSYKSEKHLYLSGSNFEDEADFLSAHVRLLCYAVDVDSENTEQMNFILLSWARHCERTLLFYSNHADEDRIKKDVNFEKTVELVYYDSDKNATMTHLLNFLKPLISQFDWFVYVPADVYLIPSNLRYFIKATEKNHREMEFLGRPNIAKLSGLWSLSDDSPLVISRKAILQASSKPHSNCLRDSMNGKGRSFNDFNVYDIIPYTLLYNRCQCVK